MPPAPAVSSKRLAFPSPQNPARTWMKSPASGPGGGGRAARKKCAPFPLAPCKPFAGAFYFKSGGVITVRTQAPGTGRKTFQNPDSFGAP